MRKLPTVRPGLVQHRLDAQVLVYDPSQEQVHLLDQTTGSVLRILANQSPSHEVTWDQVTSQLTFDGESDTALTLALDELRNAGLLQREDEVARLDDVSRREVIRRLAVGGLAAAAIPAIATLRATKGYAQGTVPNRGTGRPCTVNSNCISGNCCFGICAADLTCPQVNGAGCSNGTQCQSTICCGTVCAATCGGSGNVENGGPCPNGNSDCISPSICLAGVCKGEVNATCTGHSGCQSAKCCDGQCRVSTCGGSSQNCNPPTPHTCCTVCEAKPGQDKCADCVP